MTTKKQMNDALASFNTVVQLIESYENANSDAEKQATMQFILASKSILKESLNKLNYGKA